MMVYRMFHIFIVLRYISSVASLYTLSCTRYPFVPILLSIVFQYIVHKSWMFGTIETFASFEITLSCISCFVVLGPIFRAVVDWDFQQTRNKKCWISNNRCFARLQDIFCWKNICWRALQLLHAIPGTIKDQEIRSDSNLLRPPLTWIALTYVPVNSWY